MHLATALSAAAAVSAQLFADDPLPDIGSDISKALWEASQDYSCASAYSIFPLPVTKMGAHSVLRCEPLSAEASKWLGSFEAFAEEGSKRREQEAAVLLAALLAERSTFET
jgi:hypothetical protein